MKKVLSFFPNRGKSNDNGLVYEGNIHVIMFTCKEGIPT